MNRPLRVFLCHSSADKPAVRELYQKLRTEPWIQPWLDEEELFPGMDWDLEIEKAIEETDVIIVFLSKHSITQEGYVQREIRSALDYANYKPEGTLFIIPIRLEECVPPKRLIRWQYADYFEGQRDRGFHRLLVSLKKRADALELLGEFSPDEGKTNTGGLPSESSGNKSYDFIKFLRKRINSLFSSFPKIRLPVIKWKFPKGVVWSALGVAVLSLMFYVLLNLEQKYPVNLFVEAGRVIIYSESDLKSPRKSATPDETLYYLCDEDVDHQSYLIAVSQDKCNSNETIGWVRARVVKKLFSGDFLTPKPQADVPVKETATKTATLLSPSPSLVVDFYPVQLFVSSGRVTLYGEASLKTPIKLLEPDRTIYYLCMEDTSSKSYLIAIAQQNCNTQDILGWVRVSSVIVLFSEEIPYKQP